MRTLFIINRHAGKNERYKEIERQLAGLTAEVAYTEYSGHATELARSFALGSAEPSLIFACGGDGTISEVISGVYDVNNCTVAPVPIGSGNDFIRSFDRPKESFLDVTALLKGEDKSVDLLRCNDKISMNSVTVGYDCAVAKNVDKFKKMKLITSGFAYKLSIFYCLFTKRSHEFDIIADGEKIEREGTYLLSVSAKGKYYGGGIKCAPLAVSDDGLIDFMYVPTVGVLKFVSLLSTFIKGGHINNPKMDFVHHAKFSEVEYISDKEFDIGIDGEIFSVKDAKITVLKNAQKIRLPLGRNKE